LKEDILGKNRDSAKSRQNKRIGYIVAIIVNTIVLIVLNQLLNWNIFPFLTQNFKDVLPIQNISLAATIIFNAAYLFYDPSWFTSLLGIVTNSLGVAVVARYLSVFPFDFSEYSGFNWTVLARVLLIIGLAGCIIGIIAETVKFIVAIMRRK
jgi:hypothetical protein